MNFKILKKSVLFAAIMAYNTLLPVCADPGSAGNVVLFGSSIVAPRGKTRIFGELLQEFFDQRQMAFKVINTGVGGNSTRLGRMRFERDVLAHSPKLTIILFGINDSTWDVWREPPSTGPRVPLKEYTDHLSYFVGELRRQGGEAIFVTPPKLCWTPKMIELYGKPPYRVDDPDGFNVSLVKYVAAMRQLAAELKVPLADTYAAYERWQQESGKELQQLLPDGMHPNSAGHLIMAELIIEQLEHIFGGERNHE